MESANDFIKQFSMNLIKSYLEKILNQKVDLVSDRALSKYIKPIIDSEKKLIYAR